jgi:hypothetical protein
MSRPQTIDESHKGLTLKKVQKEKLQQILEETKGREEEQRLEAVRTYLNSKNIVFRGLTLDSFMDRRRLAVHMEKTSYFFPL